MFRKDVFDWILQGCDVSESDYAAALRCRGRMSQVVQLALDELDFLLTPTTPFPAQRISYSSEMLSTTHHLNRFAFPFSWAGLPKVSVSCGFTAVGLSIGMLLNGRHREERLILRVGSAYQAETAWHMTWPTILGG